MVLAKDFLVFGALGLLQAVVILNYAVLAAEDNYQYSAMVTLIAANASENDFFKVKGKAPKAALEVKRNMNDPKIYMWEDYGHTSNINQLCNELKYAEKQVELRDRLLSQILFPGRTSCAIPKGRYPIHTPKKVMFNNTFWGRPLPFPCKPVLFKVEFVNSDANNKKLVTMLYNVVPEMKYKCAVKGSVSAKAGNASVSAKAGTN